MALFFCKNCGEESYGVRGKNFCSGECREDYYNPDRERRRRRIATPKAKDGTTKPTIAQQEKKPEDPMDIEYTYTPFTHSQFGRGIL